ncbi:MAG: ABC transporter substrate-binding protein, partial [Actinobacteria bacterium]|nr:ABC transporter substrate-binding protein [Actinomycetota bacterium]
MRTAKLLPWISAALAGAVLAGSCTTKVLPVLRLAVGSPHRGGTLRVLLTDDVDSLDPHRAARPSSWFFVRALHRGLLGFPDEPFPAGARPVPDLADGMPTVDLGGRRYTFHLRAARFSDGTTITSADVMSSLARALRIDRGDARYLW